jgi:hypothetical protein
MQAELCEIEQEINALDNADVAAGKLSSMQTRNDDNAERVALMRKSEEKLRIYGILTFICVIEAPPIVPVNLDS